MRIALVTDAWFPQINGVVRTLSEVQRESEQLGHTFTVVHPGLFRTFPCPRYPEIRLSVLPGRGVSRLMEDFEPAAIHIATEGPLGWAARAWCGRRGAPFTTSYHTQFAHYLRQYAGIPQSVTYRGLRWFHSPAARTLVPTPSIAKELEARRFRNLTVWTRGVDTNLFRPWGEGLYDDPRPIFVYAGRVAREKNIEAFLHSTSQAPSG
jgi:glycosyltransferase involved in cell wall biosynthesis